jgi:glycosyltransferase involved in cell wall biosynthesis
LQESTHLSARSILILDWYYRPLLDDLLLARYTQIAAPLSFMEIAAERRIGHHFGMVNELARIGWAAEFVVINSIQSVSEWLRKKSPSIGPYSIAKLRFLLGFSRLFSRTAVHSLLWPLIARVIAAAAAPSVVYSHESRIFRLRDLRFLRRKGCTVVLQQSFAAPSEADLTGYDGIVSCLRAISNFGQSKGVMALHLPLGIDPRSLEGFEPTVRDIDVSFVGSVSAAHPTTIPLLRAVALKAPGLQIYGPESPEVLSDPILSRCYMGEAWGRDMLKILNRSKVTLNRHGIVLGNEAANFRLYEATISGAALVTDEMNYLSELFEPGKDVLVYRTPEEAANAVQFLLENQAIREAVAQSGKKRALEEHTLSGRMRTLSDFLQNLRDAAKA